MIKRSIELSVTAVVINHSNGYCTYCGRALLTAPVGAEEIVEDMYGFTYRPYTAYDRTTGKRNWGIRYYCPNTRWYNKHSDYTRKEQA